MVDIQIMNIEINVQIFKKRFINSVKLTIDKNKLFVAYLQFRLATEKNLNVGEIGTKEITLFRSSVFKCACCNWVQSDEASEHFAESSSIFRHFYAEMIELFAQW